MMPPIPTLVYLAQRGADPNCGDAMSYTEESRQTICPSCGKLNHIIVAYAGDYRANEREEAACFNCQAIVDREKCLAMFTGETLDAALRSLRRMQNRA